MIYFDNAATSLRKPGSVARAVFRAVGSMAGPGRGGHRASMCAADAAYRCREAAAELFHAAEPDHIVFTMNATHGLNMAIKSLVRRGERVVVSGYEHNSVMRPLYAEGARVFVASSSPFQTEETVAAFDREIRAGTKLVVMNHVSNVFGFILPIERIGEICRERGVPFIVDASQSAGVLEIRAKDLGARFIAMPGHKGLYGPQGTGILICKDSPEQTILEGGTGGDSISLELPEHLPNRLEVGTHNMPGISGLLEGLRFVKKQGTGAILRHERKLLRRLLAGFQKMPGLRAFAASDPSCQVGVLSFCVEGADCEAVAAALASLDVAVRAGLHCSPLAHQSAGTLETGTVRLSFSAFNTEREVEQFLGIFSSVLKKLRSGEKKNEGNEKKDEKMRKNLA